MNTLNKFVQMVIYIPILAIRCNLLIIKCLPTCHQSSPFIRL